jgi:hypothetical protein
VHCPWALQVKPHCASFGKKKFEMLNLFGNLLLRRWEEMFEGDFVEKCAMSSMRRYRE